MAGCVNMIKTNHSLQVFIMNAVFVSLLQRTATNNSSVIKLVKAALVMYVIEKFDTGHFVFCL